MLDTPLLHRWHLCRIQSLLPLKLPMLYSATNQFWSRWLWVWMQGLNCYTWKMEFWGSLFYLWSNSSPLQSPTRRSSRKGSFLLGRVTTITMWVIVSFLDQSIIYHLFLINLYIWNHMSKWHSYLYEGLFVDSSLGDASICSSKFGSCFNRWLGRDSLWWDPCFSIEVEGIK